MNLSDLLSIIEIIVTILIGFVISHIVSVRDTRTRAIKDHYIQELTDIKKEINEFYYKLHKGEYKPQDIIKWYYSIRNKVDSLDKAVRKTFILYDTPIAKVLFNNYNYITKADEFNSSYSDVAIVFNAKTINHIEKYERVLYAVVEQTLYDINNINQRDYFQRKWYEIKDHYTYYHSSRKKSCIGSLIRMVWDWIKTHLSRIITFLAVAVFVVIMLFKFNYFMAKNKNDDTTILIQQLDSLNTTIKQIVDEKNKREPIVIDVPSNYSIFMENVSTTDTIIIKGEINGIIK